MRNFIGVLVIVIVSTKYQVCLIFIITNFMGGTGGSQNFVKLRRDLYKIVLLLVILTYI